MVVGALLAAACSSDGAPEAPPETRVTAPPTEVVVSDQLLRDVTATSGLAEVGAGDGATVLDFDEDGYDDVLLPGVGALQAFRNRGDATFEPAGSFPHPGEDGLYAYAVDLTGDGRPEIVYIASMQNYVFMVDKSGALTEIPGLLPPRGMDALATVMTFGDFDTDGAAELYFAREMWSEESRGADVEPHTLGIVDRYVVRRGPVFIDRTAEVGMTLALPSLAAMTIDLDGDGNLDLLLGSREDRDAVYLGDGHGGFEEVSVALGMVELTAAMGYDAADVDDDGDIDLMVSDTSLKGHTFYRGLGDGTFESAGPQVGLDATANFTGWGVGLHDFDHDGDLDMFVANGHPCIGCVGGELENHLLWNDGYGHFTLAEPAGDSGLWVIRNSRGAAFSDFDRDGDLDVLVRNTDGAPTLLRNEIERRGHWLQVRLVDPVFAPPVGAVVTVKADGKSVLRRVKGTPSWGGSSTQWLHFGLAGAEHVEQIEVRWPDGAVETLEGRAVDQFVTVARTAPRAQEPAVLVIGSDAPPTCGGLCKSVDDCGRLHTLDLADVAACVSDCEVEGIEDYFSLCAASVGCAEMSVCFYDE